MKSYIFTVLLEALLLQYSWAGPFACIKCPIDNIVQCPEGCNEGEECVYIPRTCNTCEHYECQSTTKKAFSIDNIKFAQNILKPGMVPCPRCVNCYDCSAIPEFRENCPEVCMDISDSINFEEEEDQTESIEVDSNKTEEKEIKCPICENCIDCNENPEYLDVCPSVCKVETDSCPTCLGCIDCTIHTKYLEECPEVCKPTVEDDDIRFIVCPECENCIDCSGRPTLIKQCPSVCMTNETGEIIDNGGDHDDEVICPTCENCIDCDENPEYLECPGVCIEALETTSFDFEDEEEAVIEEPVITCPVCKHCVDCDETPIYRDICPEVCMSEKEVNANKQEKNQDIVCPSCIECIDCSKFPEYIDACPDACQVENDDEDEDEENIEVKQKKCPSCTECIDCTKHPKYLINCPTVCKHVKTEEEIEIEETTNNNINSTETTEDIETTETDALELTTEAAVAENAVNDVVASANAEIEAEDDEVECPNCTECIDCNDFPDYRIHCPFVCKNESEAINLENVPLETETTEKLAEAEASLDNNAITTTEPLPEETVNCPPCEGCVDCESNPKYLEVCPKVCHIENNENAIENNEIEAVAEVENEVGAEANNDNISDELTANGVDEIIQEPTSVPSFENNNEPQEEANEVGDNETVNEEAVNETEGNNNNDEDNEIQEEEEAGEENVNEQNVEEEEAGDDNINDQNDEDEEGEEVNETFAEELEEEKKEIKENVEDEEENEEEIGDVEEKEEEEEEEEVIEVSKCPACKECKDCKENPEFIDACPGVCKRDPDVVCPMCMGCMNCKDKPMMRINCPSACGI